MARNVEIKARLANIAMLRQRLVELGLGSPTILDQEDVFFAVTRGRLKLRRETGRGSRLVAYQRADALGPKTSRYVLVEVPDPAALEAALSLSPGLRGRVVKRRELSFSGRTRIHVDEVEGLGSFLELEVVLEDGEDEAIGVAEAQQLMKTLGLETAERLTGAYIDMLENGDIPEDASIPKNAQD